MRVKSLKSRQILRAHMPYFRRPGHIYRYSTPLGIGNFTFNTYFLIFVDTFPILVLFIFSIYLIQYTLNWLACSSVMTRTSGLIQKNVTFQKLARKCCTHRGSRQTPPIASCFANLQKRLSVMAQVTILRKGKQWSDFLIVCKVAWKTFLDRH